MTPARRAPGPRRAQEVAADADSRRSSPLTVGTPEQVIERTLSFRDYVGDYQRQLFLLDHAGLPLKTVLEQIDLLGEQVVPVLRKEFAIGRPADVPDAPTHAGLLARSAGPATAADQTRDDERSALFDTKEAIAP